MNKPLFWVSMAISIAVLLSFSLYGQIQVGEIMSEQYESPHPYRGEGGIVWEQVFHWPEAGYITVHFSAFDLAPGDYVEVSSPDGKHSCRYTGQGKKVAAGVEELSRFWSRHIPGDTARVRLFSRNPQGGWGFTIDRWARGYEASLIREAFEAIEAPDRISPEMNTAVARLLINGTMLCSGFLVGSEGHIMTTQRCIGNQEDADNTDYEFMAQAPAGNAISTGWLDFAGKVEADCGIMVRSDYELDYSLILLDAALADTYGYLQFRAGYPGDDERHYTPLFAGVGGKGAAAAGNSGAPVISHRDRLVVAMHQSAAAVNHSGIPMAPIITHLGSYIPRDAIGGFPDQKIMIPQSGYIWEFSLWAGRVQCAAYPPGDACAAHEWRATFEAIAKDSGGVNRIDESGWTVDWYDKKSASTPSSWVGPFSSTGCSNEEPLLTIDGEWESNIYPLYWWVKARIQNATLGIDVSLIGKCNFWYYMIEPTAQYTCSSDYKYGVGEYRLARIYIVNQAPSVNAGADKDNTWPAAGVSLSGQVSDDGYPDPPGSYTTLWSKYSGPGSVSFGNASSLSTSATFSAPGTYVLRLTADDGELQGYDDITVIIYEELSASISGPSYVLIPDKGEGYVTKTWTSSVSGGQTPYSYIWYRKVGTGSYYQVGTGSSYSYTYSFVGYEQDFDVTLKLRVTEANGQIKEPYKYVFEDSVPYEW